MLCSLRAVVVLVAALATQSTARGSHDVVSAENVALGSDNPDFYVNIYAPHSSNPFPIIFFMTGFGANAPISGYSDILSRIVNKGYIVVGLSRLSMPNYPLEAQRLVDVLKWAKDGHLKTKMQEQKLTAVPDFERTAVMGQSSGNHIVGQALADNCMYAKAFVMIDPVDGVDPFGIIKNEDLITPGTKVNFTIPALILDNGLDPKGVRAFKNVACMPIQLGTPRWYNAWRGPIWRVNATAYGHVDCLNDGFRFFGGFVCPSDSKTNKTTYREHLAESADLFLDALFEKQPERLQILENASHFKVDVILQHDRKGLPVEDIQASCKNLPSSTLLV